MVVGPICLRHVAVGMPAMTACLFAIPAFANAGNPRCPAAPPVTIIEANAFYKKGSVEIDTALAKKNHSALKPIFDFQNIIAKNSDAYVLNGIKKSKFCADALMLEWAKHNALTGIVHAKPGDYQSNLVQQWSTASLGLARIKLGPLTSRDDDRIVRGWLKHLALSVRDFHQKVKFRNNLYNWGVLAVGSIGYAIDDRALVTDAERMFKVALDQVQDKGYLPLEMKRGRRAASYHAFAAQPLALYQLIRSRCAGIRAPQARLIELIDLIQTLKDDPNNIRWYAMVDQTPIGHQPWLNVWESVHKGSAVEKPSGSRYMAGNSQSLTKVFADNCPAIRQPPS